MDILNRIKNKLFNKTAVGIYIMLIVLFLVIQVNINEAVFLRNIEKNNIQINFNINRSELLKNKKFINEEKLKRMQKNINEIILKAQEKISANKYIFKSLFKIILFVSAIIIFNILTIKNKSKAKTREKIKINNVMKYMQEYIKEFLSLFSYLKFIKKDEIKDKEKLLKISKIFCIISFTAICICLAVVIYLQRSNPYYFILIKENLVKKGVKINNAIYIFIYICLINAFIEEIFFRGFAYFKLSEYVSSKTSSIFSAVMFGIYHFSILYEVVNIYLLILAILFWVVVGIVFNIADSYTKNIYPSLIIHVVANALINLFAFYAIFI